ncbi:MAG: hypothetical protein NC250_07750 [Alistipes senegalensis]|nr:hypothetical protein [Bacteroides cellulosilyticus]MCM1352609.1 hypothetical protein [Alistipes senegalensis]
MKNLKIYWLAVVALVAGLFAACDDTDYTAGPKDDGAQVYFSSEMASQTFNVGDDESSVIIPMKRIESAEALTVAILSDVGDAQDLFDIPASVTFDAGVDAVDLVVSFDRKNLKDGTEYPVSLLINDENVTAYGRSKIDFTVVPWPWVKLGTGKFRDDWLTTMYSVDPTEVDVTIHKHKSREGVYMIEDMYGWNFLTEAFGATKEELEAGWDASYTTTNITINASNPDAVTIGFQPTGIVHKGKYGTLGIATWTNTPGTLIDGIITFPKGGLAFATDDGNYTANGSGMFRIILPGYEVTDYSLAAVYAGMQVGADNQTAKPVFNFTYGIDVTGIGYTFVSGDVSATPDEYVDGIVDGTDENAAEVADFEAGAGKVSIAAELTPGIYTLVAVPKDKNGAYLASAATVCQFYFPGIGAAEDHPCEVAVELSKVSEKAPDKADKYPDSSSIYWEITGTDIKSLKIYLNKTALIQSVKDGEMASSGIADLQALMDAYGSELDENFLSEIREDGKTWNIAANRDAETSYTMLVEGENIYGEKKLVESAPFTTAAIPYTGELKIGAYRMSCTVTPQDGDPETYENVFELNPTAGSDTKFTVKNLGVENGTSWHATYDAATSKLTLNGIEVGYESDGNYFGQGYGYYDAQKTMIYGFFSYASDESDGSDPCVFSVNSDTKEISAIDVTFAVEVYKVSDSGSTFAGYHGYFDPANTTIAYGETESSAAKSSVKPMAVRPVGVPFSSVRVPVQNRKTVAVRDNFASEQMAFVRDTRAADAGSRTLSVKTAKCEPLPKQPTRKADFKMTASARSLME